MQYICAVAALLCSLEHYGSVAVCTVVFEPGLQTDVCNLKNSLIYLRGLPKCTYPLIRSSPDPEWKALLGGELWSQEGASSTSFTYYNW